MNLFIDRLNGQQMEIADLKEALGFETRKDYYQNSERNLFDFMGIKPGDHILDVGCGSGFIPEFILTSEAGRNVQVTAIDLEQQLIDEAILKATTLNLDVEYLQGDACALPFENESFDLVVSHTLLKWLSNPKIAIQEMKRVLKPNGILLLADRILPPISSNKDRFDQLIQIANVNYLKNIPNPHIMFDIPELLEEANFVKQVYSSFSKHFVLNRTAGKSKGAKIFIRNMLWVRAEKG